MKTICKFACTFVVTLMALNFTSALASAQEGKGTFTLTQDVHWQSALVPAGDYEFSLVNNDGIEMLTLRRIRGGPLTFLMVATNIEPTKLSGPNQLLLETTENGSYVSEFDLPVFGISLRFGVPKEVMAAQVARESTLSAGSSMQ